MLCRAASSSSTTSRRLTGRSTNSCSVVSASDSDSLVAGLVRKSIAPSRRPALPVLLHRDDVHRDVPGGRVVLQPVENGPAVRVGQPEVERDRGRLVLPGQRQRPVRALGDQPLEAAVAGQVQEDLGEVGIVLGDEEDPVALLDRRPVVGDLALDHRARASRARPRSATDLARSGRWPRTDGLRRLAALRPAGRIDDRQVEGEGAALPGVLSIRISPPSSRAIWRLIERPRPVPPYFRLVPVSPCWNASKMMPCFSFGMPMPVSLTEKAITALAALSSSCSGFHPPVASAGLERDACPAR